MQSFGYKFYYHSKFKNNEQIDKYYNDGIYSYDYWYINKKYQSFKEELLKLISIIGYDTEMVTAQTWMKTKYVMQLNCAWKNGQDYNIANNAAISVFHILSILIHCNFTKLCTLFSQTFRKMADNETNEELKERHSEFAEFSRLLVECVHCYGTCLRDSPISYFFHGISIIMEFPSTHGQFCSPTSTTTSLSVAVGFGGDGIVLELVNSKSMYLTFFNCDILSSFGNEAEKLFILGGYCSSISFSDSSFTSLAFKSIRVMTLGHNYEYFVIAISCLQQMIKGEEAYNNRLELKSSHVKYLQLLMDQSKHENIPEYILQMFDALLKKTVDISILTVHMNVNENEGKYHFLLFREIFCELYSEQEIEENRGFIQPIFAFKFDMLFDLFPNLCSIEIAHLPLTQRLMRYILNLEIWNQMQRKYIAIRIKYVNDIYKKQNEFRGNMKYSRCITDYSAKYSSKGLKMSIIRSISNRDCGIEINRI